MEPCNQSHPEAPTIVCDQAADNHYWHTGWDTHSEEYVDWKNLDYVPPKRQQKADARAQVQEIATRVAPDPRVGTDPPAELSGFAAGVEGSERAARKWNEAEKTQVFEAIRRVAERQEEFTSDEVWAELDGAVPITKGLTSVLLLASRRGICDSTGKTRISQRGGDHDHGQRLTIWWSALARKT